MTDDERSGGLPDKPLAFFRWKKGPNTVISISPKISSTGLNFRTEYPLRRKTGELLDFEIVSKPINGVIRPNTAIGPEDFDIKKP